MPAESSFAGSNNIPPPAPAPQVFGGSQQAATGAMIDQQQQQLLLGLPGLNQNANNCMMNPFLPFPMLPNQFPIPGVTPGNDLLFPAATTKPNKPVRPPPGFEDLNLAGGAPLDPATLSLDPSISCTLGSVKDGSTNNQIHIKK